MRESGKVRAAGCGSNMQGSSAKYTRNTLSSKTSGACFPWVSTSSSAIWPRLGYDAEWEILPAAALGAPHHRESIIAWDKRSARPQIGRFRQQCEYVLFATKGRFIPHTRACLPGVYDYPVIAAKKVHLTSKPAELIEDLLAVTAPQASVLDPFMGGGSVGEACIRTGRRYIGMELSAEYFEISRARLENVLAECGQRPDTH